ncbi:MAG: RNA polymerase sigma factor [Sphingobacteriales bacterium]
MKNLTETALIEKLQRKDEFAFSLLYKFYFPAVKSFICKNSGNAADAEDIFQESIIVLFQKINDPSFKLTCSLKTYLFSVSRNLWLKRLRSIKLISGNDDAIDNYADETDELIFELKPETSKEDKLQKWMAKITENCQRILKAIFYYKEPMESLMVKMGWKNKHTADNQKYKCVQQVKKEAEKTN